MPVTLPTLFPQQPSSSKSFIKWPLRRAVQLCLPFSSSLWLPSRTTLAEIQEVRAHSVGAYVQMCLQMRTSVHKTALFSWFFFARAAICTPQICLQVQSHSPESTCVMHTWICKSCVSKCDFICLYPFPPTAGYPEVSILKGKSFPALLPWLIQWENSWKKSCSSLHLPPFLEPLLFSYNC